MIIVFTRQCFYDSVLTQGYSVENVKYPSSNIYLLCRKDTKANMTCITVKASAAHIVSVCERGRRTMRPGWLRRDKRASSVRNLLSTQQDGTKITARDKQRDLGKHGFLSRSNPITSSHRSW